MQNIDAFKQLLSNPKRIVITPHSNPDADALGSSLGLWAILKKLGHDVTVVSLNDFPGFLKWMHGQREVIIYDYEPEKAINLIENAEIIFSLDYSSLDRIGALEDVVRTAPAKKVVIDHHRNPEDFADFTDWSIEAGATGELIFDLCKKSFIIGRQKSADIYNSIFFGTHCSTVSQSENLMGYLSYTFLSKAQLSLFDKVSVLSKTASIDVEGDLILLVNGSHTFDVLHRNWLTTSGIIGDCEHPKGDICGPYIFDETV